MLSLFSSCNVIKLLVSFITLADVLNSLISRYLLAGCRLHLGFLEKLVPGVGSWLWNNFLPSSSTLNLILAS